MKKFLIAGLTLLTVSLSGRAADALPERGEMTVDFGIGVGMVDYSQTKALFTQRVGVEWVVMPEVFSEDFTLAAGVFINNGFGAGYKTQIIGTYDYSYTIYQNSPLTGSTSRQGNRKGMGTANVNVYREDINILPTVSLRYHASTNLDCYMSFGIGAAMMNTVLGKKWNYENFKNATVSETLESTGSTIRYSYDDLKHTTWQGGNKTKGALAIAWYIGARYAISDNWGINAQVGLLGANLRKSMSNSYNIFSLGASYTF